MAKRRKVLYTDAQIRKLTRFVEKCRSQEMPWGRVFRRVKKYLSWYQGKSPEALAVYCRTQEKAANARRGKEIVKTRRGKSRKNGYSAGQKKALCGFIAEHKDKKTSWDGVYKLVRKRFPWYRGTSGNSLAAWSNSHVHMPKTPASPTKRKPKIKVPQLKPMGIMGLISAHVEERVSQGVKEALTETKAKLHQVIDEAFAK